MIRLTQSILLRCKGLLTEQLQHLRMTEHTFMVIVAVIIGLLGGFGAIFFRFAIRFFEAVFFGSWEYSLDYALQLPWYVKLLAPAAGGLIVGPIVFYFAREARGHGVPEVMESIVLRGGAIRPRVMIAKVFASAVSIGSGGSVGREGPIVQIGSAIGSSLGQALKVTGSRLRTFVACGTAAGIAATFNAPIAGALFAMEVILSDFGISQFSPIVVSSVTATVVSRHFIGDFSAFILPSYELVSVFEMIPYFILGILSAFVALGFISILYKTEDLFETLRIPPLLKPILGGLIIGAIGIFFPHIFGVGYDTISLALNGEMLGFFMLFLVGLKIIATSITIGSGGSGGVFAPSLFLGANLGGFVGSIVHSLAPSLTASPGAYALVGMGAVASGAMHAPITSILIIFELTNDYRIILPLMIACIISVLTTTRLKKDSIYTLKLSRRGINLFQGQEVNVLRSLQVSKVMKTNFVQIAPDTSLRELMDLTVSSPHSNFFVVNGQGQLIGIISIHDVRRLIYEYDALAGLVLAYDLMKPIQQYFTQTDTLDIVIKALGQINIDEFPVVKNEKDLQLLGTVAKEDVIGAYNQEMLKRDMITSVSRSLSSTGKFKQIELTDGQILCELEVPGAFIGKTLQELNLRSRFGTEVIMIKQNFNTEVKEKQHIMVPRPDYHFAFGDSILVMASQENVKKLRESR
ncbi:MAG: chloride channel protein [Candidatus Electrothrix aestuarii]|uniref:Chloride channel protein n=1 Tax=Candidatus Electrothrix aestuarii TaxID=3062594 RepID=A0AAU8LUM6_9BACT|nr:chloride channel protein [Candidatus Electrothrix aestuarii]